MSEYTDRLERERRAAEERARAFDAAVSAIARWVPDLRGLILNLEKAGGSARLRRALRTRLGGERRHSADIGGEARPDAGLWARGDWR